MDGVKSVLNMSNQINSDKERTQQESLHRKYKAFRGGDVGSVEK